MSSSSQTNDTTEDTQSSVTHSDQKPELTDASDLPPSGTSLHKRRRGEPPVTLTVNAPQTPSDAEGSSPFTAGPTPDEWSPNLIELPTDPVALCETMIQCLKDRDDAISKRGKDVAFRTKETLEALNQLEKLMELLDQIVNLKEKNASILKKLRDVQHLKRLDDARKKLRKESQQLKNEEKEIQMINAAFDEELASVYEHTVLENMLSGGRSMKRSGSRWKGHSRFGGSLLRKQRSRSAGGEDSDVTPGTPLRRRSDALAAKEMEKSKVSKWTRVKAVLKWEKAQWPATASVGGAAGAVAAGALVGAVALAGSAPSSASIAQDAIMSHQPPGTRDASLTPGSAVSLTPDSSCEELRMDLGTCRNNGRRGEENDNMYLQAPTQDDSSTSPSPNKVHKTPWSKMRDMLQHRREAGKEGGGGGGRRARGSKTSPDVIPVRRRRSLSDGGDSDAPPQLTLTIPSNEELESEPYHPLLRKQLSLELASRQPQQRPPRQSKWSKVKKAFLTSASASVPSSPNRHSAFFTDPETEGVSSGCEASVMREEIARNYAMLQNRLGREFSDRRGKLHDAFKLVRPVATEEQLSADFRKKIAEWQRLKPGKQPPPVPARQDLNEDFLKKYDAWQHMKETNSVPPWEERKEAKPDEVLVQTSKGLYKFKGVTRSFTRKLQVWEKSQGIAPEASTSALLQAARAQGPSSPTPLTRAQSDGSVGPAVAASGRLLGSSFSVNDNHHYTLEYEGENSPECADDVCDGDQTRGALLIEVEAEEVCTAAPLYARSPRHTPQKPIYTYGNAEARLLCETSSAITGTAVLQSNGSVSQDMISKDRTLSKSKAARDSQAKSDDKSISKRNIGRQTSIEEDAKFIRQTIEEIERGSSSRHRTESPKTEQLKDIDKQLESAESQAGTSSSKTINKQKTYKRQESDETKKKEQCEESNEAKDENKRKDFDKTNGKKKSKSRARLERELSKPSESDTEPEVDTVTVEIPRRRKRPRRPSERPKTPPTSLHSDSQEEIFVLKLQQREGSPEVIVKTTRKIFSPVVRSGESVHRAVIPVDVDDLADVKPIMEHKQRNHNENKKRFETSQSESRREEPNARATDAIEGDEQKTRNRPPLPLSPSSQRKPQPKETAPSIRIMIQKYNMKINEEGHTSGASSGASSPAWRSPTSERRRPPDMPVGVNIRNNPFLEREVQKSASACQLSRREQNSSEKRLAPTPPLGQEGVLKSRSANAIHPDIPRTDKSPTRVPLKEEFEGSQDTCDYPKASTDTIVPDLTRNLPDYSRNLSNLESKSTPNVQRQFSETACCRIPDAIFERSVSVVESPVSVMQADAAKMSARTAKIRAAKERFLSSSVPMRREGTNSASDLRPGDRSSRISCDSDVTETHGSRSSNEGGMLGRSASLGMVNVEREAWERVNEGGRRQGRSSRSRFSLARLAAKLRRKDAGGGSGGAGAVSRLCRQSLLVQLRNKQ